MAQPHAYARSAGSQCGVQNSIEKQT